MSNKKKTLATAGNRSLTVALSILAFLGAGGEMTMGTAIAIVVSVGLAAGFYVAAFRNKGD